MPTLWRSTAPDWTAGEGLMVLQLFQNAYPLIDDFRRAADAAGVDLAQSEPLGGRWDHAAILRVVADRRRLLPLAAALLHDQTRSPFHQSLRLALGMELPAANVELLDAFGTPQDPESARLLLTPETVEEWRRRGDLEALNAPGAFDDSADARARAVDNARNRTALIRRGVANRLGTGVLIGPDLLLTAGHVITHRGDPWPPTDAGTLTAVFDYRDAAQTLAERGTPIRVVGLVAGQPPEDHEWLGDFQGPVGDDRLDFAVLRLARPIGREVGLGGIPRGWFHLDPAPYDYNTPTHFDLWGHPRGEILRSTFTVGAILPVGEARIRYTTNTDKGSSGSPVVDHLGRLVAIHHFAKDGELVNQAVPIARIYLALTDKSELNQPIPTTGGVVPVAPSAAALQSATGPAQQPDLPPNGARKFERKAEKRSEWAVDVCGTRERLVNATQRLTLDRMLEVAVVQSAGVTRRRLAEAEKVLDVVALGWTPRYWYPIDANAVSLLDQWLPSLRDRVGDASLSLLIHGKGGDVNVARELHLRACAALGIGSGPTVLVGARWQTATHQSVVWLRTAGPSGRVSAAIERRLEKAIEEQRLGELVDDPRVPPLSALAAIARSGDLRSGRLTVVVDELLTRSSASVRDAWEMLESGKTVNPSAWAEHTREFVALVVRGGGGAGIPLASLPTDLLRESYLHDEILRLSPNPALYKQLIALPEPARRLLGLVDNAPHPLDDRTRSMSDIGGIL